KEGEIQKIIIELSDYGSQMWEIKIKDFGKGMDQNTLKHAFVPRFTTKSTGMGLGLVMVKNIINDWNGTIDIESVLGQGTTFIIRLPRYSEEMEME
ncbi:MAG TPA: HAMP domain-containing sensor histidine kinase, partial [Bacteroidales bacterium]|nr:HAMP domain-containing sensor histidine kinase [Bacteroidales bacterium]